MRRRSYDSLGCRLLRTFALFGIFGSAALLSVFWYTATLSVSWMHDNLDIAAAQLERVDTQLQEIQHAVEPYDLLSKDFSKKAAAQLHGLVTDIHDSSFARAVFAPEHLDAAQRTTGRWMQALQTRIPAKELVDVRNEIQIWHDEITWLRASVAQWVYLGAAGLSLLVLWFALTQWALWVRLGREVGPAAVRAKSPSL